METLVSHARAALGRVARRTTRYTWQGIYSNRSDVPGSTDRYDDEIEVNKHLSWTRPAFDAVRSGSLPPPEHQMLTLIAAMAGAKSGSVRVIDLGGAVGAGYVQLLGALPTTIAIEYHVVDLEKMCSEGKRLFSDDPRIQFHKVIPQSIESLDIVYANSVLQYIDHYEETLAQITSLGAEFVLLGDLPVGNIPTYATKQLNLVGKVLAYWFFNRDEIVDTLAQRGYSLIYEGLEEPEFDQENFPQSHRIGRMRNLLFRRAKDRA
jgi:putative methyltransferase (TIGR04325 family)